MANKEGLGISRKFAIGTAHENASGQFMILNRYLEDETVMLEYQWLAGENEGKVDINKERNINASIHKFQVSRSLPPRKEFGVSEPFGEKIDEILEKTNNLMNIVIEGQGAVEKFEVKLEALQTVIHEQQIIIAALFDQISRLIEHNALLTKQQETLNKLVDKI